MLSSEFCEGEEDWSNLQQPSDPASFSLSIQQYQNAISSVTASSSPASIDPQLLKHHRIAITHDTHLSSIFGVFEKECFISIKKKLHFGTHVVYDVVLANFLLEIHLLNIHRNSDEKDLSTSESELGSGGFGSVRKVAVGGDEFAVKRINFVSKAERVNGFDIDTEKAEHQQIRKAIRQYSLFKICSMLGIGPRVLFSSFDLVCFNNCMEFAMELCLCPSNNPRFLGQHGLSVESLQLHLLENLKILHSLKIVHKDIKPENILYSQSLSRFVFADFGISHAVAERPTEKTRTNFAGTIEYCSEEMKEVLSTGAGYVNLYMNDFVGLTKTIAKFNQQAYLSSSISRNAMSYNQSNGFVRSQQQLGSMSNSIEQWFDRECSQSCSALSPLKQSSENIYITSTHSLDAPSQFSSQINYYEALILYELTKHQDSATKPIPSIDIVKAIESYAEQINDDYILEQTRKYVIATFYPSENSPQLSLKIVELKNTARNYGPKSEETLRKVEELIEDKEVKEDSEVCAYFTALRREIIEDKNTFEEDRFIKELLLHLHIKNYTFVIGCGIRILREAAIAIKNASKHKERHSISPSSLCKIYIICNRLDVLSIVQKHLINQLFLQVWDHNEHEQLLQSIKDEVQAHSYSRYGFHQDPISNRITAKLMRHAVFYLIKHEATADQEVIIVLQYFLKKYDYTDLQEYKVFYRYLQSQTDRINSITDANERCSLSVELAKVYRKMCILQNHFQIDKEQLLQKVEKLVEQLGEDKERKYYYFACAVQLIWMQFHRGNYSTTLALELLDQLKTFQCRPVEKNQLLVQLSQIMGCIFIKTGRFDESFNYLLQTQSYIKQAYGAANLSNSYFECLNNIAYLLHQTYRYQQAFTAYQNLLELVERTNKALTCQKSLLYRAIITIRIELGVNRDEYPLMYGLIKKLVQETIFALISLTASDNQLSAYVIDASIFSFIWLAKQTEVKIFVMKALLKHIEDHLHYFQAPYDKINYELNKMYVKELGQPSKGLAFIWNYIKIKLLNFRGVTRQDFKLMNDFIANLIKHNSSRRALIILKKYIFHLPPAYYDERKTAFRLLHKIHFSIAHPLEAVTALLIARDCENLYSRNFSRIYRRENSQAGRLTNMMLQKWLARL